MGRQRVGGRGIHRVNIRAAITPGLREVMTLNAVKQESALYEGIICRKFNN